MQILTSVINAWSKRGTADAPERAEALLQRAKELNAAGNFLGSIDVKVYNSLLSCWSSSSRLRPDACKRAESGVQHMDSAGVAPDTITFNTLMQVWSAVGNAERCENILDRMREMPEIRPGPETLCTVLAPWSQSPSLTIGDNRAEFVLKKLYQMQESLGITANVACYNLILDCLGKSSKKDACLLVEDLLHEMERLAAQSGEHSLWPNTFSFTSVLNAFADAGYAESAEVILENNIMEHVKTNNGRMKPNVVGLNIALKAWAQKCRKWPSPEAPARAEALIHRMRHLHKTTGMPVKPDVTSHNTLINVWANSGVPSSNEHVLAILQRMMRAEDK